MDNTSLQILNQSNYHQEQFTPKTISSPIVDFRIAGQSEIRRFDGRIQAKHVINNESDFDPVKTAQRFVNQNCRAFCVMDGADIRRVKQILQPAACDWYQQRQEWEIK